MCLCRPGGLRLGEFVGLTLWKRLRADDHILRGQSHKYRFGFQQHAELGDDGRDEHCHHAGNIHFHIGKRFNEHEPNGDDHLHADRDECHRLDHFHCHGNCHRQHAEQANHQLLHS